MFTIRVNAALTEQIISLLNEYDIIYSGNEVIAFTTLTFNDVCDCNEAYELIADHFGSGSILSSEACGVTYAPLK